MSAPTSSPASGGRRRRLPRPGSYGPDNQPITGACYHCDETAFLYLMDIDHLQALGFGGTDVASNRRWLCLTCHRIKSAYEARVLFPLRRRMEKLVAPLLAHGVVGCESADDLCGTLFGQKFDIAAAKRYLEQTAEVVPEVPDVPAVPAVPDAAVVPDAADAADAAVVSAGPSRHKRKRNANGPVRQRRTPHFWSRTETRALRDFAARWSTSKYAPWPSSWGCRPVALYKRTAIECIAQLKRLNA
jgi:hypothetical protein